MAMQAASPAAALPSAQVVGNAFVDQYYHILHQSPELVYKFYQESSVLSRPDANGVMNSVTTLQAINDRILSLNYENYRAEIKNADAQDSYEEGVIVLVTGYLTGKENVKRKFVQSFFLAPQENGYFVLNDIFRYVDESEQLDADSVSVSGINDGNPVASLTPDQELIPVADHPGAEPAEGLEAEDTSNEEEFYDPLDHDEGSVIEEEVIVEPPTRSSHNESDLVVCSDLSAAQEEKKSYASIVKVTRVSKTSTSVYIATSTVRAIPANTDQQSLGPTSPSPEPEAAVPTGDSTLDSNNTQEEVEGHSIYIRNLPLNATVAMLEEEFKKFGTIKRGGIQVRSNKLQGFCFGFVEFAALDSIQNAIKASPVTIGNRQAVVEEKRTTMRVNNSSARGRYHSSRGGFRNDNSFRGRGNFGGSRGYGRNDFRNQSEFLGRSRGPTGRYVEGYQRVDQNDRGSRQGWVNKSAAVSG